MNEKKNESIRKKKLNCKGDGEREKYESMKKS